MSSDRYRKESGIKMSRNDESFDDDSDSDLVDVLIGFFTSPVDLPEESESAKVGDLWWESRGEWLYPWRITGKCQGYPCGEPKKITKIP